MRLRIATPAVLAAQSLFFDRDRFKQTAMIQPLASSEPTRDVFERAVVDVVFAMPTNQDLDAIDRASHQVLPDDEWLHWNALMMRDRPAAPITNSLHDQPFEL